jgi:hypothetical protein
MASVGKRQEKQARETMKLREKDSKKQNKERDYFPYVRQVFQDNARIVVLLWARSMTKTTTIASILTHKLITNS